MADKLASIAFMEDKVLRAIHGAMAKWSVLTRLLEQIIPRRALQ